MDLAFTEEQEELRRTLRGFLEKASPESEVRRQLDTAAGYDPVVWRQLAADLGVVGLAIPEEYGGAGYGFVELGIVLEEAGRALLCAPLLSTAVLVPSVLLALGDEAACADYLPAIAAGESIAALAYTEPGGADPWDAAGIAATASQDARGWRVDGVKSYVVDGHSAALLLVAARTGEGVSVFAVDGDAPGVRREQLDGLDPTRRLARVSFTAAPARLLGAQGAAWPALTRALDLAAVAVAAEQAGGAARACEMAVEYAKTRVQYGKLIGSFQAIKHKLADMHIDVESARSAAQQGLASADSADGLPAAASLAKACCGDAFMRAAAENIQVHGGIGFTWEHPAQLYFKRAKSTQVLFGHPSYHRKRLARLALADRAVGVPTA